MNYQNFQEIGIDRDEDYKILRDGREKSTIRIKKVNLFIGANNSGKSRFLRKLFCLTEGQTLTRPTRLNKLADEGKFPKEFPQILERRFEFFGKNFSNQDFNNLASEDAFTITDLNQSANRLIEIVQKGLKPMASSYTHEDLLARNIIQSTPKLKEILNEIIVKQPSRTYIPILRGLRPLEHAKDVNKSRTTFDYFPKEQHDKIETGFNLFQKLTELLLGKPEGRQQVAKYQNLLSAYFFQEKEFTLIPEHGKDVVAVKIGDDEQFPIYHLGDGLQQLIIMTSSAFFAEAGSMIFVEEPETNLHPGYLRKLIKFFLEETSHQYFLTTHSNAILDMAETHEEITIHRFTKESDGFKIYDFTADRAILKDLGISPASVYLANSTIWVEGITDRLYLKCYLKRYLADQAGAHPEPELIENLHYSFVEYQGSTLGHWMFSEEADQGYLSAARVCANALVICDGDIKNKGKRQETLEGQLGNQLVVLDAKEIENLLPEEILKQTVRELLPKKRSAPSGLDESKVEQITYSAYCDNGQGIGAYLDELLNVPGSHFFAESSGTIKDKLNFCRTAVQEMEKSQAWQLPEPVKVLCEKVIQHIRAANHLP